MTLQAKADAEKQKLLERAVRAEAQAKQMEKTLKVLEDHMSTLRAALQREINRADKLEQRVVRGV